MESFFHVGSARTIAHLDYNEHAHVSVNMVFHWEVK